MSRTRGRPAFISDWANDYYLDFGGGAGRMVSKHELSEFELAAWRRERAAVYAAAFSAYSQRQRAAWGRLDAVAS